MSALKNLNVLIADDSSAFVERLVAMITEVRGSKIIGHAPDAHKAMQFFRDLRPDVVILDLHMPGGNGIQVLEHIKQLSAATIVVVLTNFVFPQYRQRCLAAGADFFLDKSTEIDQVPELLGRLSQKAQGPTVPPLSEQS
jgi:DNA-binding NarL/FixJ family response regulator